MQKLLMTSQVERRLLISRSMVLKLISQGELRAFKVGSQWRIYADSVENYMARQENCHSSHAAHG